MKQKLEKYLLYIVIAAVIAAVAVFVALYAARPADGAPEVMLPAPEISGGGEAQTGQGAPAAGLELEVNPDTVRAVLETITRAESYTRSVMVLRYSSEGPSEMQISVSVRGSDIRVTETDEREVKNRLITRNGVWIWFGGSKAYYHGPAGEESGVYKGIPGFEELLEPDFGVIEEAAYVDYEGEPCVYARYTAGVFGFSYRLYISAATGLVMGAETYADGELIYEMRSLETDISTPEDEVFTPPL